MNCGNTNGMKMWSPQLYRNLSRDSEVVYAGYFFSGLILGEVENESLSNFGLFSVVILLRTDKVRKFFHLPLSQI